VAVLTDIAVFMKYRKQRLEIVSRGGKKGDDLMTIISFE